MGNTSASIPPLYLGQDARRLRENIPGMETSRRRSTGDAPSRSTPQPSPSQIIAVNAMIRPAPKFSADKYYRWREEVQFRKEIRGFSQEDILISENRTWK